MMNSLKSEDFNLLPLDFVRRVFDSRDLISHPDVERHIDFLAYKLEAGCTKLDIIRAVDNIEKTNELDTSAVPGFLSRNHAPFLSYDLLLAFSPDDDEVF